MRQLTYYTPRTQLARVSLPLVAVAASYLPPRALRPIVKPCARWANQSRRPRLRRHADRTVYLLAGDAISIRVRRQRRR